jgi:hypothetical protein
MPKQVAGAGARPAGRGRGRPSKIPAEILPLLREHVANAEKFGTREYPLGNKAVARLLGFSHNFLSESGALKAPVEHRGGWLKVREVLVAARTAVEGGGAGGQVRALRARVKEMEQERERLWAWMVEIEIRAMDSLINTELLIPDDLRFVRAERRKQQPQSSAPTTTASS